MLHRHLNHEEFTLAAIDDIIGRGKVKDWVELRDACRNDSGLRGKIAQACRAHTADPCAQRFHLWLAYVEGIPA